MRIVIKTLDGLYVKSFTINPPIKDIELTQVVSESKAYTSELVADVVGQKLINYGLIDGFTLEKVA